MKRSIKICHIGWIISPHTSRWVKWFADRGHESYFITNGEGKLDGVKTYIIPESFGIDRRSRWERFKELSINHWKIQRIRWIRELVKEIEPDILHSHALWYPGNLGVFASVKNYAVTVMNGDVLYHHGNDASMGHHLLVMYAMRKAKMVTGVSQTLIDAAIKHGARGDKACVIRRGVDFKIFNPDGNKSEIRNRLGISAKYVVLSPRYLAPVGNVETLIRAVPLIVRKIQDIQFIFIFPSGNQLSYLQDLSKSLQIENYLNFIGRVPHEEVGQYHRVADIMVSIPLTDSGPIAMQEAMACGAVPVMSDLPCVREWIEPDVNGVLVPARDKKRLAQNTIDLLLDEEKRNEFAMKNIKLITERGNTNKIMEEVERHYFSLLNK